MKDIYLTNYSVKGIKTLDKTVSLSFYKKTINKEPDTRQQVAEIIEFLDEP